MRRCLPIEYSPSDESCGAGRYSCRSSVGSYRHISRSCGNSDARSATCQTILKGAGAKATAAKIAMCRWLDLFIVARIEFLEWTPDNRLRHPRFAEIRSDKDARDVVREIEGLP
jgi:ATP dependent DNA ligase C terminal region